MKNFKSYLESEGISSSTIESYWREALQFINWAETENLEPEQAAYNDILSYIHHLQKLGRSQRTVQLYINGLRHYINWLVQTGARADNPIQHLVIKGVKKKALYHILSRQELDNLYENIGADTPAGKRNKAITGLMVWQGVETGELSRLEVSDLKLREGKINIRGNRKSNDRLLKLESHQVLDLMEYTLQVREAILKETRKASDKLFVTTGQSPHLKGALEKLCRALKRQNPKLKEIRQIRASVITHWLKIYNLRQVQYMAGHRYVSSTEAYLVNDVEDLMNDIEKYHPL